MSRYGMVYACAQKNAGPAGVTIVIVRDDLLARAGDRLPAALTYRTQVLVALSRYDEARLNAEEALGIFQRLGTVEDEVHSLGAGSAASRYRVGTALAERFRTQSLVPRSLD